MNGISDIDLARIETALSSDLLPKDKVLELEEQLLELKVGLRRQVEVYKKEHVLDFFKPNSKVQEDFIYSQKRESFLFGGEGAGKTKPAIYRDVLTALGRHPLNKLGLIPTPNIGWVSSEDSEHVIEVIQRGFTEMIPKDRLIEAKPVAKSTSRLRYKIRADNGGISEIIEKSFESGWKKHQGREINWSHDDEEPPYLIYKEHIERLRLRGFYWCSMTPTDCLESGKDLWMFREIVQRAEIDPEFAKEVWIGYISKYDNAAYLGEEEIRRLEQKYGGRDSRDSQVRIFGHWDVYLSRVFDNWQDKYPYVVSDSVLAQIKEEHKTHYLGIDPHPQKPFALLWVDAIPRIENPLCKECKFRTECIIKTHYFVRDEHFGDPEKESRYTTKDYADLIKIKNAGRRLMATFIDQYAKNNERGTGSSIQTDLNRFGVPTRIWINGQTEKNNRIENARSLFRLCEGGLPQVFVLDSCRLTRNQFYIYEFDHYKRVDIGSHETVKQSTKKINDDLCDAFMGTIEKRPPYVDPKRAEYKREIIWQEANY